MWDQATLTTRLRTAEVAQSEMTSDYNTIWYESKTVQAWWRTMWQLSMEIKNAPSNLEFTSPYSSQRSVYVYAQSNTHRGSRCGIVRNSETCGINLNAHQKKNNAINWCIRAPAYFTATKKF